MPILKLNALHCEVTEDDLGSDEVALRVSGTRYHEFKRSMNNGQDWPLDAQIPFTTRARIEVWDLDAGRWWDPHDRLGVHIANAEHQGKGEMEAGFTAFGADYTLTFEVV